MAAVDPLDASRHDFDSASSSSVATPVLSPAQVSLPLPNDAITANTNTTNNNSATIINPRGSMNPAPSPASTAAAATFLNSDARLYPRDGRVRDPVPSKLKGVTQTQKANFAVMHMDVNSHPKSNGRHAAAKRTSEGTALQAKLASTSSYVSHHRRANYPGPPGSKHHHASPNPQPQPPSDTPASSASGSVPPPAPPPADLTASQDLVMLPLNSQEVKSEQARLLTLLRTLPPATVVDQFCKALAFFGGIPEAPPPTDGRFPESGEANGPGSLFVGWVSEIFPNLEQPRKPVPRPQPQAPETQPAIQAPQKRPRGRPKGSKASKARSDKGVKKGPLKSAQRFATEPATIPVPTGQDDDWVDIGESGMDLDHDVNTSTGRQAEEAPAGNNGLQNRTTHAPQTDPHAPAPAQPIVKKRGRPKGSKNRPKESAAGAQAHSQQQGPAAGYQPQSQDTAAVPSASSSASAVHAQPVKTSLTDKTSQVQAKVKVDRSHTSKSRNKTDGANVSLHAPHNTAVVHTSSPAGESNRAADASNTSMAAIQSGISEPGSTALVKPAASSYPQTLQVKESSISGVKRKRLSAHFGDGRVPTSSLGANTSTPASQHELQAEHLQGNLGTRASVTSSADTAGPSVDNMAKNKRSRKSQNAPPAARPSTTSHAVVDTFRSPETIANFAAEPRDAVNAAALQTPSMMAHSHEYDGLVSSSASQQYGHGNTQGSNLNHKQQKQQQQRQQHVSRSLSHSSGTASRGPAASYKDQGEQYASIRVSRETENTTPVARTHTPTHTSQQPKTAGLQQGYKAPPASANASTQQQQEQQQQRNNSQVFYSSSQLLGSFSNSQQQGTNGSPSAPLVNPHMTNSPQFGNSGQSNSSVMAGDASSFNAPPTMIHGNTSLAAQRTSSTSSIETNPYRQNNTAVQPLTTHSGHYGSRQQAAAGTGPATSHSPPSHPNISHNFGGFADSNFLDLQSLDPTHGHHGLALHNTQYNLNLGHGQQLQRDSANPGSSAYPAAAGMSDYMASSNLGRTNHQNRWPS